MPYPGKSGACGDGFPDRVRYGHDQRKGMALTHGAASLVGQRKEEDTSFTARPRALQVHVGEGRVGVIQMTGKAARPCGRPGPACRASCLGLRVGTEKAGRGVGRKGAGLKRERGESWAIGPEEEGEAFSLSFSFFFYFKTLFKSIQSNLNHFLNFVQSHTSQ